MLLYGTKKWFKKYKEWYKWKYLENRNRFIALENKLMVAGGKGEGRDWLGVWVDVYVTLFKTDNQQGPIV